MATTEKAETRAADKRDSFMKVDEDLKKDVLADPMLSQKDAAAWMTRMLDYNVPGGKLNRGLSVKDTLLATSPAATPADQLHADQIGWAIELLQVRRWQLVQVLLPHTIGTARSVRCERCTIVISTRIHIAGVLLGGR